tara:strand:- start:164 stop:340 length:177 start_codon:yes stop_codon:yes gene_type:complete
MSYLKLYLINGSALSVTTLAPLESWLKVILLVITIGYTISKWFKTKEEKEEDNCKCKK